MTSVMIITDSSHYPNYINAVHSKDMRRKLFFKVALRIIIAEVVLIVSIFSPAILQMLPFVQEITKGTLIGQGTAGLLLACLTTLLLFSLATIIAIPACRILTRRLDGNPIESLGMRIDRTAITWFMAMMLIAFIILAATTGLLKAIGITGQAENFSGDTWWAAVLITFGLAFLLQGIPEEVIYRGWLIPSLGNNRLAVITSVLVFTIGHLVSQGGQQNFIERIIYLVMPFGFGLAAAVVRVVSGSTWAAIGVHAGFHMASLLAFFLPIENSPTQWVVLGIAWLLVGVVIGWRWDFLGKLNADVAR